MAVYYSSIICNDAIRPSSLRGNAVASRLSVKLSIPTTDFILIFTHIFLILLPSPLLGVRGFALCFDWGFGFASTSVQCLESLNKPLNRRIVTYNSPVHPPDPSPRNGARGRKQQGFRLIPQLVATGPQRTLDRHRAYRGLLNATIIVLCHLLQYFVSDGPNAFTIRFGTNIRETKFPILDWY